MDTIRNASASLAPDVRAVDPVDGLAPLAMLRRPTPRIVRFDLKAGITDFDTLDAISATGGNDSIVLGKLDTVANLGNQVVLGGMGDDAVGLGIAPVDEVAFGEADAVAPVEDVTFVLFHLAQAELRVRAAGVERLQGVDGAPGLWIAVRPTDAAKCVRCWHRRDDVGSVAAHPELCGRCASNVDGPGETRRYA